MPMLFGILNSVRVCREQLIFLLNCCGLLLYAVQQLLQYSSLIYLHWKDLSFVIIEDLKNTSVFCKEDTLSYLEERVGNFKEDKLKIH